MAGLADELDAEQKAEEIENLKQQAQIATQKFAVEKITENTPSNTNWYLYAGIALAVGAAVFFGYKKYYANGD